MAEPVLAAIKWDETGEREFETGVDHGVLYPIADNGTYPQGYGWNGLTSVSESPEGGEPNALYADNMKYLELMSNEEWKGTIEAYMYPDEFEECDGSASPETGVSFGQQARKKFGLAYRTRKGNDVKGDAYGYKLHLVYGLMAAPSEKSYETVNDSPDAITFSWSVSSTPVPLTHADLKNMRPISTIVIDSTKADEDKLAALEEILYGKDPVEVEGDDPVPGVAPRLPLPDEVYTLMKTA